MKRKNKIIAILGMISSLSLTGCQDQMEIPTGEYTTIGEYKNEDLEVEERDPIVIDYNIDNETIQNTLSLLLTHNPINDSEKVYLFLKSKEYTFYGESYVRNKEFWEHVLEVTSGIIPAEDLYDCDIEETIIGYTSVSSSSESYSERIYRITYNDQHITIKDQGFADSAINTSYYERIITVGDETYNKWVFVDNGESIAKINEGSIISFYTIDEMTDVLNSYLSTKSEKALGLSE